MTAPQRLETGRITLQVMAVTSLIGASIYVLLPFLPAIVWAATISVATWPALLRLQARLGGRRGPAVAIMTAAMLALVVVPLYLAIASIIGAADRITELAGTFGALALPPPPEWVGALPVVGEKAAAAWRQVSDGGHDALVEAARPYVGSAVQALASRAGSFGATIVQFLLVTLLTGLFFASGEAAALGLRRFFRRLAGERGEGAVLLAGKAVRAVALGVVVTALAQTVLSAAGLYGAGVPRAGLLTALVLVLCIAQIGPGVVLVPAVIWSFSTGRTAASMAFLVWTIGTLTVDNFLRPYLIKKGASLPLWLIFAGVIGGLLAFGVIGLFVGPVILAVAYTLLESWVGELGPEPAAAPAAPPAP